MQISRDQSPRRTRRSLAGFLLLLSTITQPTSVLAQSWDRLADGRTIIIVKGHKFAFPTEGYDVGNIRFNYDSLQDRATLPEVVADPQKARSIFERRRAVSISFGVGRDRSPFWNMYDRDSLRNLSFSFNVGENQMNCQNWAAEFGRVRKLEPASSEQSGAMWRAHETGSATMYTYAGPEVGGVRADLQNLVCNGLSSCSSSICLAPDIGFAFRFSSKDFPEMRWIELLGRVDAILKRVIGEDVGGGVDDVCDHGSIDDRCD